MQHMVLPPATIGIIGGGQLGKMMAQQGKKLGYKVHILDPTKNSPAGQVSDLELTGNFYDKEKLRTLVQGCQVSTYDLEHVDVEVIQGLVDEGFCVRPSPQLLGVIQDKLAQKQILRQHDIPTSDFVAVEQPDLAAAEEFGLPLVQKARRGGYDGRGVFVMETRQQGGDLLPVPSIFERKVEIAKELAVMVARGLDGQVVVYSVAEMVFDPRANVLDMLLAPARIAPQEAAQAQALAIATVEALRGVGIFGVELFLGQDGGLYVNEVAPRPHNSGHYTIEAAKTCQFEQHLRAICGLPLGSPDLLIPAAMINLLGEADADSEIVRVEGLDKALAMPGVYVHLYGKHGVKPFRKMGHAVVVHEDITTAYQHAVLVKQLIKIKGGGS